MIAGSLRVVRFKYSGINWLSYIKHHMVIQSIVWCPHSCRKITKWFISLKQIPELSSPKVSVWIDVRQSKNTEEHDDVIKWKHFLRHWPFVRGIHRSPVNSPHKGQWRRTLIFSLICVWLNGWVNIDEAGAFRRHRAHYGVTVMVFYFSFLW